MGLNQELIERGELVDAQALTGPELAKIVVSEGSGPRRGPAASIRQPIEVREVMGTPGEI